MPPENKQSEDAESPLEIFEKINIISVNTLGTIELHEHDRIALDENTALILLQKTRYRA